MSRMKVTAAIILLVLVAVAGGAYYWWTTTPMYAFQEAGVSVVRHDLNGFRNWVNLNQLVDGALQDLLFGPLEKIPGFPEQKRSTVNGALEMIKKPVTDALSEQIEDYVAKDDAQPSAVAPAGGVAGTGTDAAPADGSLKSELKAALKKRIADLKEAARKKMEQYAAEHPDSLEGRLLNLPRDSRKAALKEMLASYGFTPANFKGIAYSKEVSPDTSLVGAWFFSNKLSRDLVAEIELTRGGQNNNWHISRLSNLPNLISALEPNYEHDIQNLALYSVSEAKKEVAAKLENAREKVKERMKESGLADNLLRLKEKFKEQVRAETGEPAAGQPQASQPRRPVMDFLRKRFGRN